MPNPAPARPQPPENGPLAAVLSYLVPGVGQIYQGRIGKGILFFICVYTLFFFGMYMGRWSNVFAPDTTAEERHFRLRLLGINFLEFDSAIVGSLWKRPQFAGQFFVGVAAWPAIYQAWIYDPVQDGNPPLSGFMRQPPMEELESNPRDSDKTWDLAWVYTVIAGVLNVMVIYDAFAGPAFVVRPGRKEEQPAAAAASPTPAH